MASHRPLVQIEQKSNFICQQIQVKEIWEFIAEVVSHRFEGDFKVFSAPLLCFFSRMSSMSALFKLSMWIRVFAYISTSFYPQHETQLLLK